MKGRPHPQFCDRNGMWTSGFALTSNELNTKLKGAKHFVSEMFGRITAFERKFLLWELQP